MHDAKPATYRETSVALALSACQTPLLTAPA